MTEETLAIKQRKSAFLAGLDTSGDHIVDTMIKERCPSFVSHWSWPVVRPMLYSLLGYRKACNTADFLQTLRGQDGFDHLSQELAVDLTLTNIENMPKTGRLVVAANHPTGLADGVAVWDALRRVRRDIVFFANADAIRVSDTFSDVIIPVEWVMDKRTPAKTRETLRLAKEAFAEEKCVVIFPSGKLAKKIDGVLTEQDWMPSVVSLARKHKAPIQPLNVRAENSWLYYFFSKVNGELRDITLFHELLNKSDSSFDMTFGPLISPGFLEGDVNDLTSALRDYVACQLGGKPEHPFIYS
ncbi:MAG: 1-acyl-sn-glycerol-3-phosphate acyltransferase [Henriciella sp.]|nr:1-acyl-sn-glycerol-3-phosphate acyltransferase [Henriciella sp.]